MARVNKTMRPDALDELGAFRAGWRHGQDHGAVSPREAEDALRNLTRYMAYPPPITAAMVDVFCNGADDGARGDAYRYRLSFYVA